MNSTRTAPVFFTVGRFWSFLKEKLVTGSVSVFDECLSPRLGEELDMGVGRLHSDMGGLLTGPHSDENS